MKIPDPGESPWHWLRRRPKFWVFVAVTATESFILAFEAVLTDRYPGYGQPVPLPRFSVIRLAGWFLLTFSVGVLWYFLFYWLFPTGVIIYIATTIFGAYLWQDLSRWLTRQGWFYRRSSRKG